MNLAQKLRAQMGVQNTVKPGKEFQIQYGHNGSQVVVIFPAAIQNLQLNEAQVDAMVTALTDCKRMLIETKAGK